MAISTFMLEEKNKVDSANPTLALLEITIPATPPPDPTYTTIRIVANNENITWNGQTWQAAPVEIDEITSSSKGAVPSVDIRIGNENRQMRNYIEAYDVYTKLYGYAPITVVIYIVNAGHLTEVTAEAEWHLELIQPRSSPHWATFTLGAASPFLLRYPTLLIKKNHCQVMKFKDAECAYVGVETVCDRTLTQCRAYSNSGRFKAFPGAGNTAIRI